MYLFTRLKYFVKNMKESFYDFSELDKFNHISNVLTLSVSASNLNQKRCQTNAWTNVYDYTHSTLSTVSMSVLFCCGQYFCGKSKFLNPPEYIIV